MKNSTKITLDITNLTDQLNNFLSDNNISYKTLNNINSNITMEFTGSKKSINKLITFYNNN